MVYGLRSRFSGMPSGIWLELARQLEPLGMGQLVAHPSCHILDGCQLLESLRANILEPVTVMFFIRYVVTCVPVN